MAQAFFRRLKIAILTGTAFLSVAASSQETTPPSDQDMVIDQLAFLRDRNERLTVPVTIGGHGPFRFFIDTGAQATAITPHILEVTGLEPTGSARLVALGSSQVVQTVEVDEFAFANRSMNGLVSPLLMTEHLGADGILGLDSLQDLRVLIDFRDGSMSVADASERLSGSDYEIVVRARPKLGQMVITDARVNGVRTAVIIDTGAQNSIANLALLKKLRTRTSEKDLLSNIDVHGVEIESLRGMLKSLQLGKLKLSNVPVGFADGPAFTELGFGDKPAMLLGMRNLRVFDRVAIDFSNRKILFDVPSNVLAGDLLRRSDYASHIGW
ncbi:hypothetical protein E3U23_02735 [Erythrobacter litoralis]|uniref:retropepsin-like aspartic protease n=1 Tax=Erythrobacter litoralis TaxID=39960 RepID=UPI002435F513|nr:retropepsin-like aspartic protease [Erythrobacter litoralis]MDG6078104.1 hypothetical protein [Erythrobacter litoralis]